MSARFVVLGLARPRTPWFSEVGRWATSGSAPIEFIRCVSREEVAANLASGRGYSALLIDGASLELDRDLVEDLRQAGSPTIVVEDRSVSRDWPSLGVLAVLPADFSRTDLVLALDTHATPLDGRAATVAARRVGDEAAGGAAEPAGRWISVVGGGSGTSVLAMALAQAFGDREGDGRVVLTDLALDADQAMLHAAPDIVPGLSELVELHRAARVSPEQIRELTFTVDGRRYELLLGLRRHRDWAALRPRATDAALDGLSRAFPVVVADCDGDVEGEADCGSVDVEERNGLARAALRRADAVVVVGTAELTGLHALVRTMARLRQFGIETPRLVPVVNRAPRSARARAEVARAVGSLTGGAGSGGGGGSGGSGTGGGGVAGPLFVPSVRRLDAVLRDGGRLPDQLGLRLAGAVAAVLDALGPVRPGTAEPEPVRPGELGALLAQRAAS